MRDAHNAVPESTDQHARNPLTFSSNTESQQQQQEEEKKNEEESSRGRRANDLWLFTIGV